MKSHNDRKKHRIAASVICALCAVMVGAGTMSCQISEPHGGRESSFENAAAVSELPRTDATSKWHTVTTKPQTANTTEPHPPEEDPWFEDEELPVYVIESGIVWYGGGYYYGDSGYWKGKWLVDSLEWAIADAKSDEEELKYAVKVVLFADDQYQYNGKTLAEYEEDEFHERVHPLILEELLEEGDQLKYGELLYTTGTPNHTPGEPDGELWAKEYYDQKIEYYGEELLAKYIVDGEFLRDKVIADMEADQPTVAKDALREARIAYLDEKFQYMREFLTEQDVENAIITAEESDVAPEYMIFFATKGQFANLSCADLGIEDEMKLSFSLAAKDAYSNESLGDL